MQTTSRQSWPRLERRGGQAAYRRLYEAFRDAILSGQLGSGERLPSSRQLASHYGVARITVVQAYDQLAAEGYLESRRGSGTFVAAELPEAFLHVSPLDPRTAEPAVRPLKARGGESRYREPRPFLSGCPELAGFPREIWLKLYSSHLRGSPYSLNIYGHGIGGFEPLREAIALYLNTHRGLRCRAEQILVLSGSQPGIELTARMLTGRASRVAVENPSYRGITQAFRLSGAELVGVPVDEQGMVVEALQRIDPAPSVVVATASRQFPLGYPMSISRRAALLEWASSRGAWILEDDYDSELRFRGNPLPAMQGMDREGRILYLGTFSRSMFPDIRIGYLVAPEPVVKDFQAVWQAGGMNPPIAMQATLADFIRDGHYLRHLRRMRLLYAKRSAFLASLLEERLGDWFELGLADGGLHFVAYFRRWIDAEALAAKGEEQGLWLFPLSRYAVGPLEREGLIFGFSSYDEAMLMGAVDRLVSLLEEEARQPVEGC